MDERSSDPDPGEAADCLIRAYYDEIYRFVYRQVGSRGGCDGSDADHFYGNAPVAAVLRRRPRRIPNLALPCRCQQGDRRPAAQRPAAVPLEEAAPAVQEDFTGRVRDRELLRQIEGYVRALDPALQTIFRLRIYAEAPFPEIAAVTGQPESKIKAQYYRLLGRLRKEFGKDV